MSNPISVVKPEVLMENKMIIHQFLKQTYNEARRQLDDGINCIQDGISFIKDEFSDFHKRATRYISRFEWPVNNFIKDPAQLESELKQQLNGQDDYPLTGTIVPEDNLSQIRWEENY